MNMRLRVALATAVYIGAVHNAQAQAVFESKLGRAEVIGLRRWTVQMLADSVAAKAPGESLFSHACAAILQQKLGFPAAAVSVRIDQRPDGTKPTAVLITVVEPQDSARVRVRRLRGNWILPDTMWPGLRQVALRDGIPRLNEFMLALQLYGVYRLSPGDSALAKSGLPSAFVAQLKPFWIEMAKYTRPFDLDVARRTLAADTSRTNRLLSTAVLSNFREQDATWHSLAAAARDPSDVVRDAAVATIKALTMGPDRQVNWSDAADDLRVLLGGTNVWGYRDLLTVLAKTKIAPSLSKRLLSRNTDLLAGHLAAMSADASEPAIAFARQISGRTQASKAELVTWLQALN